MINRLFSLSLAALLLIGYSQPIPAEETVIFGPQIFVVDKSKPLNEIITFDSSMTGSGFTFRVQNGTDSGQEMVTSGTVTLNDTKIITPSDLKPKVPLIEKTVTLNPSNKLKVDLGSKKMALHHHHHRSWHPSPNGSH